MKTTPRTCNATRGDTRARFRLVALALTVAVTALGCGEDEAPEHDSPAVEAELLEEGQSELGTSPSVQDLGEGPDSTGGDSSGSPMDVPIQANPTSTPGTDRTEPDPVPWHSRAALACEA